ncbi:autotransporter assembly complex protein TamA [Geomonas paludis]|uniref:Translocation and assembly module subunit TamA n=1 Tax=Geomonas paludis TaxID=2740185 RepID=A0A6V8MXN8_9BACT|nr:autotransporter assembly complex family protein [Geomonas paludis]UPU34951.1 autotransporter assembly complex protein TamA [Geomonas paludis]GFO64594.1 outer membrane protein assembly factor [Geomonas paludis]
MSRIVATYLRLALSLTWLFCVAAPALAADPVEVVVAGVEGDAQDNVRRALELPHGLVRDGKVDRLWLERFARQAPEKARVALQPYGFYRAKATATVREGTGGKTLVEVAVDPGEPVRVVEVDLKLEGEGAQLKQLRRLAASFPLAQGQVLLQPDYERAKSALQSQAQTLGYLDAGFPRHEIRISPDLATARIHLTLDTGGRYYFDGTHIEGGSDYPEVYLKRFIAFKEGDPFSYAKLGETQLNFANSERFRQVVVTPQREEAKEHKVPVLVRLTAVPRRTLRPGVGYGTDTGGRFSVHYRDLNLAHEGNDLDLSLYMAERLQGFAGRYTMPSASDLRSSTSIQLNLQRETVSTYQSRLAAVEFDRNFGLGRGEVATPYLKIQQENYKVANVSSQSRLVLPGFRFSKDRFNDLVRPTSGYRVSLDLRGAHQYFGSDTGLVQGIGNASVLIPIPGRLTFHARANTGYSILTDPLAELPPSIRFFAGGDQSVRGYAYQSLGPRDAAGRVVGGKHLLVGSLELERALFKNWGVSIFDDIGNAFNEFGNVDLKQGVGVGAHYYTPVGGLNLYLAHPLAPNSPPIRIHFTVGFEF